MGALREQEKRLLLAACCEARTFNWKKIAAAHKIPPPDAQEALRALEKAGLVNVLPSDEAVLTSTGRELAASLTDQ